MPTFDVVNEISMQEVDNAINITKKALENRYDFKGSETEITLNRTEKKITVLTSDDMKLRAIEDALAGNLIKRKISPKALEWPEPEQASKGALRCIIKIRDGIETEQAKKIVKIIKESKLKVQARIQDEQVRVEGKKIDDLQAVIALLKEANLDVPLQYVNMRS
ncbi:MAG: YajQ family cyclic di-GMP-binding protein [Candidatus Hydrogenedentes bacterium]|nr:YajQ family cyclic di-GMP-binding protein [Candidatus Hydrogenedentota bacterium]